MTTNKDELRQARYERAALAILSESSIQNAAFICDVSSRTLQRYLSDPEFQAILHETQEQVIGQASARLASSAGRAVEVLESVMLDDDAPAGVRCRAADLLLQNVLRFQETITLSSRIKALEDMRKGGNNAKATFDTN